MTAVSGRTRSTSAAIAVAASTGTSSPSRRSSGPVTRWGLFT